MNYETNGGCACTNCPVDACQCGCRAAVSAIVITCAELACNCGSACDCELAS